ncbi:MAG: WbqC family protein [Bacteroidales bacterium]|nr:WbqC family protein [Bacteroidales bacterium]
MSQLLLSTAYLPNIQYIRAIASSGGATIEQWESFPKQTYRNRCEIATAGGRITLTVPVVKACSKQLTRDVRISYDTPWQSKHWQAIKSAYGSAPFFMYFKDELEPFYKEKTEFLLDYNQKITATLLSILDIKASISLSDDYIREGDAQYCDLRNVIHPKVAQVQGKDFYDATPYPQVFDSRMPFEPNLSVIDAIFNEGGMRKEERGKKKD